MPARSRQPGPTHLLVRGDPTRKGAEVDPAAVAASARGWCSMPAVARGRAPAGPGAVDRRPGQSAAGAGDGQPGLALPFRPGDRRDAQRLRLQRRRRRRTPSCSTGWRRAYIADGWRLKPIHRLIVLSATYRQSSRLDAKAQAIDRDNRLLWRMSPRRLEAESIRDAILATSGRLDTADGRARATTSGSRTPTTWRCTSPEPSWARTRSGGWSTSSSPAASPTRPSAPSTAPTRRWSPRGATSRRRRSRPSTCSTAGSSSSRRRYFAERLEAEAGPDPARQAERGFRLAFGRAPIGRRARRRRRLDRLARHARRSAGRCTMPMSSFTFRERAREGRAWRPNVGTCSFQPDRESLTSRR